MVTLLELKVNVSYLHNLNRNLIYLQIEMFLLGHTLKATLQVVRPSCYSRDDFICYYPDNNIGVWPEITLIAEDDRHYNVLTQ